MNTKLLDLDQYDKICSDSSMVDEYEVINCAT